MWSITNRTRYAAESTWGRDKDGVHEWIVAVKATFDIDPHGTTTLADVQPEPLIVGEYRGEFGLSSLRYDADLVPPKPTTDIVLNGTAYAPGGQPASDFLASVRVGTVEKAIRVRGHRNWERGPFGVRPSRMRPLTDVPIVYERAFGGHDSADPDPTAQRMDTRNPIGCGIAADPSRLIGQPLPNFEYPQGDLEKAGPAGFGPLDVHWSPRRELSGTYDQAWVDTRRPLLPRDWDSRCLLCSPADQRPQTHLRGGEPVELINLTATGVLRFTLPRVHLAFSTLFLGHVHEHRSRLSTVTIEPDVPRVILLWITALPCRGDIDYLEYTAVSEKRFI